MAAQAVIGQDQQSGKKEARSGKDDDLARRFNAHLGIADFNKCRGKSPEHAAERCADPQNPLRCRRSVFFFLRQIMLQGSLCPGMLSHNCIHPVYHPN